MKVPHQVDLKGNPYWCSQSLLHLSLCFQCLSRRWLPHTKEQAWSSTVTWSFSSSAYRRHHGSCSTAGAWQPLPLFPWVMWNSSCSICSAQPPSRLRAMLCLQLPARSLGRNEGGRSLSKPNTLWNRKIQSPVAGTCGTLRYQCQVSDTLHRKGYFASQSVVILRKRMKWDVEGVGRRNEMKPSEEGSNWVPELGKQLQSPAHCWYSALGSLGTSTMISGSHNQSANFCWPEANHMPLIWLSPLFLSAWERRIKWLCDHIWHSTINVFTNLVPVPAPMHTKAEGWSDSALCSGQFKSIKHLS